MTGVPPLSPDPTSAVGIGMTDKYFPSAEGRPAWLAWYHLQRAAESMLVQDAYDRIGTGAPKTYLGFAMDNIRQASAALGYDLVPRLTPKQAHDTALANRRAEDPCEVPAVTSAPGFDGRARGVDPDT